MNLFKIKWGKVINFAIKNVFYLLHETDKSLKINVLESSYAFFISSSMLLLLQWIDVLFLGYFKSASDVGIYTVAVKISMFSSIILFSINSIVAPKLSDFFTKNKIDEFKKIIKKSSKLMFFLTIPVLALIIILSDFVEERGGNFKKESMQSLNDFSLIRG